MEGRFLTVQIEPLYGVYVITLADLTMICETAILHTNPSREGVAYNSKATYLIDIRMPQFTQLA
jgi:hypothetical protein